MKGCENRDKYMHLSSCNDNLVVLFFLESFTGEKIHRLKYLYIFQYSFVLYVWIEEWQTTEVKCNHSLSFSQTRFICSIQSAIQIYSYYLRNRNREGDLMYTLSLEGIHAPPQTTCRRVRATSKFSNCSKYVYLIVSLR